MNRCVPAQVESSTTCSRLVEGDPPPLASMPASGSTVSEQGPGGTGWSFGLHKGEVDSAGISIWPGPGQASTCFSNGDSAGLGWSRALRRDREKMPQVQWSSPSHRGPVYHEVLDGTLSTNWFSTKTRLGWERQGRSVDGV